MRDIRKELKEFKNYHPELTRQHDFHKFWEEGLSQLKTIPLHPQVVEHTYPIKQIKAYRITYQGAYGTPIKAYYIKPMQREIEGKCILFFHGYGGNKGAIAQYMPWLIQGYAVFTVDCRGMGETGDTTTYSFGSLGSWVTMGLLNKEEYYYYKVYLDCIRAVEFVMTQKDIDPDRVCLMGASLGGGIAMAVAALDPRPALVVADVPNMCDIPLTIMHKSEGSFVEVEKVLSRYPEYTEEIFKTLSYFDILNHASQIQSRIRVSVALKDLICPPKPIFGVYNRINAEKTMEIYPFSGHDAPGSPSHIAKTITYVNTYL